ncbi:MAG: single-stranded DNA-binding protein [Pseudomonadota bacterium]
MVNKCLFIGRLAKDPETKYTPGGVAICTFSIAVGKKYKDKKTGEQQEKTTWVNIKCFNRLAEVMTEYLRKGSKVYVEGELETESWDDRETGKKVYKTVINANEIQMLDSRNEAQEAIETVQSMNPETKKLLMQRLRESEQRPERQPVKSHKQIEAESTWDEDRDGIPF